eukprot:scaffold25373_cov146-Isochrysis_galbana.AAC.1
MQAQLPAAHAPGAQAHGAASTKDSRCRMRPSQPAEVRRYKKSGCSVGPPHGPSSGTGCNSAPPLRSVRRASRSGRSSARYALQVADKPATAEGSRCDAVAATKAASAGPEVAGNDRGRVVAAEDAILWYRQ